MLRSNTRSLYLIGQGYQNCIIPAFLQNHFFKNPHVYTPYTPYQAEISQGRLELLHNYQSIVSNILNKNVAVASMLDSGQVGMDIITLMKNINKRKYIFVQNTCYQTFKNCLNLRASHQNITLLPFAKNIYDEYDTEILENTNGIIIQTPDTNGTIQTYDFLYKLKKDHPHLLVGNNTDLMVNIHYNMDHVNHICDFIFGNGGNMGVGLNYGGPQPAFLASSQKFIRQLPGKIVGKSITSNGEDCYRLALQTREQHIRREKATSNICTNQALLANLSGAWMMYHGNQGLKQIAEQIYNKTYYVRTSLNQHSINSNFFNTITFNADHETYKSFVHNKLYPFYNPIQQTLSLTFDETHTDDDIERITRLCKISLNNYSLKNPQNHLFSLRKNDTLIPEDKALKSNFKEQELQRYLHKLSSYDYSLMNGLIPLGSCTMKYTPVDAMEKITNPTMNIHPYINIKHTPYKKVVNNLSKKLQLVTGFDHIFYQGQSGAMGEYAGLSIIKNYHKRVYNTGDRDTILMPKSAHGTNASTSNLCGFKVHYLKENDHGMIDMDHFIESIVKLKGKIAGLMITYPSTYGLFERNIKKINKIIHDNGGLVYMDGANMNALMGKEKCANLGFDMCHFNLHKTFAIPHGGGGPGMGPIGIKRDLISFLPGFSTYSDTESISTTQFGSGNILQISEHYSKQFDEISLPKFHTSLMKQTQYIISQLKNHYTIKHVDNPERAHEFIIDCAEFKSYGIKDVDISKRLMDYGFHAPTMSWPIPNSLMIEITESEPNEEINRFITSMIQIKQEIITTPELLKNAPHTQYDIANWNYDYSIASACYPLGKVQIKNKFWANVNKVNDIYGDKLLLSNKN